MDDPSAFLLSLVKKQSTGVAAKSYSKPAPTTPIAPKTLISAASAPGLARYDSDNDFG